jgi:adenylate cyclase
VRGGPPGAPHHRGADLSDADIALLEAIRPTFALYLRVHSAELATDHLLRVYLGQNAAQRVLDGAFVRGSGERIDAAIWFCDLRGFTAFSDRTPLEDVVCTLDRYFESVATPVVEEGGEVLKFIGDAMLAVFPVDGDPKQACAAALRAARRALDTTPEVLRSEGLSFGIALHLGSVMYGNLGAAERLDFTVIGPAVNEASRVEGLCKTLGEPLLVTARFAEHTVPGQLRPLGAHALRGVREPQELFTLAT